MRKSIKINNVTTKSDVVKDRIQVTSLNALNVSAIDIECAEMRIASLYIRNKIKLDTPKGFRGTLMRIKILFSLIFTGEANL
jgi:hypothetical protein